MPATLQAADVFWVFANLQRCQNSVLSEHQLAYVASKTHISKQEYYVWGNLSLIYILINYCMSKGWGFWGVGKLVNNKAWLLDS